MALIFAVIVLAFAYDLTNGWNDSANAIATVVSTKVLTPWKAVMLGASLNFLGALFSSEVARTVGREIAQPHILTMGTFLAAVVVAPIWITLCTYWGLPISCSHSLLGALIGSVLATAGTEGLHAAGIRKIVFGVFVSPVFGFLLGGALMVGILWIFRRIPPAKVERWFGKLQLISASLMAFSHGTGDAQKAMGIITGALLAGGFIGLGADGKMHIPLWVRLLCATAMSLGTIIGGWRVIKTLGARLAHLKPSQGFAAETGAALTILANTLTGVPISTTHSITGAIIGVGTTRGVKIVKWGVGAKIIFAWVVTFPVCIGGGALTYQLLHVLHLL